MADSPPRVEGDLRRSGSLLILVLVLALTGCPRPAVLAPAQDRAPAGAVASAEKAATDAGVDILRAGGGAADAAVAVALVLAVVQPQAGNLGGGGFAVVRWGGEVAALDFRETAPSAARRDMFRSPDELPIPEASTVGPLAAGVPGSPAGLFELHRRYGRLPWTDVVAPAAKLARDGFTVSPRLREAVISEKKELGRFPETASVWLPGGKVPEAGSRIVLPELARTLSAYAAEGPTAMTSGPVAAAIERASRNHGGILSAGDLAAYRAVWREPVRFEAFGWEVASMPLPSSGGCILGQTLMILQRLRWQELPRARTLRAHLLVEAWRRGFADRYLLGDPQSTQASLSQLLAPGWTGRRASGIRPDRATPSDEVRPWPDGSSEERSETTHLSVADGAGNLVALTTTLNGWFGCYLYVPGAGYFLNNEMDDFTTIPGQPNLFDLTQGEANAVRPGARMLSSMSPAIAWRDGEALALGSPGGSRIPTAVSQVLLNLIVDGDMLQAAVDRPRFHHQWLPDEIRAEPGALDAATIAGLERMGHRIRVIDRVGEVNAVRLRIGHRFEAAGDPRGPGVAEVINSPPSTEGASRQR